jgi:hypothetical protein
MYADKVIARLTHMIPQWVKKFGGGRQESTLENFKKFVMKTAKVDEEISTYKNQLKK